MHKLAYELQDLRAHFDANKLKRAEAYFREGRVSAIEYDPELYFLSGNVRGSGSNVYQTCVIAQPDRYDNLRIQTQCDCGDYGNCKHAAALMLAAYHQQADSREKEEAPRQDEDSEDSAQGQPTQAERQWLTQLKAALAPAAADSAGDYCLLYLLKPGELRLAHVDILKVRKLKKGGYGAPHPFRNRYEERDVPSASDSPILEALSSMRGYLETGYDLQDRFGADLLERMMATGRCYLDSHQGPPLRPGEPLAATLAWQVDHDGRQQASLTLPAWATGRVIELDPFYLIQDDGQLRPLDLGVAPRVAKVLLHSPLLTPEAASALREHLPPELPRPRELRRGEVRRIAPRPVLTLSSEDCEHYYFHPWLRRAMLDAVELGFDYGGTIIAADDQRPTLTAWRDDRLDQIPRQPDAEAAIKRRLEDFDLLPLDQLGSRLGSQAWLRYAIRPLGQREKPKQSREWRHNEAGWREFMAMLPQLRSEGWRIRVLPDFHYCQREPDAWIATVDERSGNDWFGLKLDIEVDGRRLSLRAILLDLLRRYPDLDILKREPYVETRLPDRTLIQLPTSRLVPLLETLFDLFENGEDEALAISRYDLVRLEELAGTPGLRWQGGDHLRDLARRLADFKGLAPIAPPKGLQATLRTYQLQGLAWLQFLREYGFGGILADDMGLGKTIQALAHLLTEKEAGRLDRPGLIVAPTSLVHNWRREAERFAPSLKLLVLHGAQRQQHFDAIDQADLVITTYPLLARDIAHYRDRRFHYLLLDEAQQVKNAKTQTAQTIRQLDARHRLCLTGTPMENHLGELWAQFDFLMPGWLGDEREFQRRWRTPIEKKGDGQRRARLARRVAPFLLRRTKEQVATELPAKTETVQYLDLDQGQRDLYETVRLAMDEKVRKAVAEHGVARSHILILDALLKLRQVCCDPRLVKSQQGKQTASAKFAGLFDMLGELISEGRRILLFSQFTSMLALIEEELQRRRIGYVRLAGDTVDRNEPVERFQRGEVPLFLLSLKAGGVGLNLTAADIVIHYDPWWNPAVESQATDRAYRIGQDKPVFVYKLVTRGTVEEKILALQAKKAALAAGVLGDEAAALAALTAEELVTLLAPVEED